MNFLGIPVYFDRHLEERKQFRFPRSKKRRIRKKWAKRSENYRNVPQKVFLQVGEAYYIHPDYFPEFCKRVGIEVRDDGSLYPKRIIDGFQRSLTDRFNLEIYEAIPPSERVSQPLVDLKTIKEIKEKYNLKPLSKFFPLQPIEFEFPTIENMKYQTKVVFEKYCTPTYKFNTILHSGL